MSNAIAAVAQSYPRRKTRKVVRPGVAVPLEEIPADQFVARAKEMLWHAHYRQKISLGDIAEATGLCYQTISNFAAGRTRFPRLATTEAVLGYFGFRIYARRG